MSRLPEQRSWDNFKPATVGRFVTHRIENQLGSGMPDVLCMNKKATVFWVENKAMDKWPVRATTIPMAGKFEPGQIPFMRAWRDRGGLAFVLLRAEKVYYLLNPSLALTESTKLELINQAVVVGKEPILKYLEDL